jgi:hypothetical protein
VWTECPDYLSPAFGVDRNVFTFLIYHAPEFSEDIAKFFMTFQDVWIQHGYPELSKKIIKYIQGAITRREDDEQARRHKEAERQQSWRNSQGQLEASLREVEIRISSPSDTATI